MKKVYILLLLIPIIGCTSLTRFTFSPEYFEDDKIKIEYRIGEDVYAIKIYNKTGSEIEVDLARASIISINDESRSLNLIVSSNIIPPNSYITLFSTQKALFNTDIDKRFTATINLEALEPTPEREIITMTDFIGEYLRLYIPIIIENQPKTYDIKLKITGLYNE